MLSYIGLPNLENNGLEKLPTRTLISDFQGVLAIEAVSNQRALWRTLVFLELPNSRSRTCSRVCERMFQKMRKCCSCWSQTTVQMRDGQAIRRRWASDNRLASGAALHRRRRPAGSRLRMSASGEDIAMQVFDARHGASDMASSSKCTRGEIPTRGPFRYHIRSLPSVKNAKQYE